MTRDDLECPKCRGTLQRGFLFDRTSWFRDGKPAAWVPAAVFESSTAERGKPPERIDVDAYRCAACGFVELWAG